MTATLLEHADVCAVLDEVWSSFLGTDQPLLPAPPAADGLAGAEVWSATVTIDGGWNGAVTVDLSHAAAVELTRTMLMIEEPLDVSDTDIADAVGELVNMVGGNIKSLMPGPSRLSLPAVAAGRAVHPTEADEIARLDGQWAGEPIRVTVHSHDNSESPA